MNSPRSPEQEAVARFYNVSPVELLNRTFRTISETEGLSLVEDARLFGMLNVAGADTIINCWNDKRFHAFWRPITAIHEGDNDGNKKTIGDTKLDTTRADPAVRRPHVRVQLRRRIADEHRQGVLRQ